MLAKVCHVFAGEHESFRNAFRRMLCDRDPSVMFASLCVLRDLCEREAGKRKLGPRLRIDFETNRETLLTPYDYHKVPRRSRRLRF